MKNILLLIRTCFTYHSLISLLIVSQSVKGQASENTLQGDKAYATPTGCSALKVAEIKAKANKDSSTVKIDCNVKLTKTDTITKQIILEGASASGVTIDGATIYGGVGSYNYKKRMVIIRPVKKDEIWIRPENITIKNCNIVGSVRVGGPPTIADFKDPEFTKKVRDRAPKNIIFDNVSITGIEENVLYFGAGVSYSKLINSTLRGKADSGVAIYLNGESYQNTIKNNSIHVDTGPIDHGREQIAIDGSSYNMIIDNRFSAIDNGGIYLYRNCGEGEWVRHSTPSYNQIINNVFYYENYKGTKPSVYIGSRNGKNFHYCDDDGSADDLDHARHNIITQNRIFYVPSVPDVERIQTNNPGDNGPNYCEYNEIVTSAPNRPAGCVMVDGDERKLILDGESVDTFKYSNGEPACTVYKNTCHDGELTLSAGSDCRITEKSFVCRKSGNNKGCQTTVTCPSGQKIIGAKAAANLEFGDISDDQLLAVPVNTIKVIKSSDNSSEGICYIDNIRLSVGQKDITGIKGLNQVTVGCKEKDSNGGDYVIKGLLYCYSSTASILKVKQIKENSCFEK